MLETTFSPEDGSTGRVEQRPKVSDYCRHCGHGHAHNVRRRRYNNHVQVFHAGRFVNEEVILAEAAIGALLPGGARVRHINGVTNDNRLENLFLELPGEPTLYQRLTWSQRRCVECDGDYFVPPWIEARQNNERRILFCSRWCYVAGRPPKARNSDRRPDPKDPARGPDPDRWRAWSPQVAALARMIPDPDPGPGSPNRYPLIVVPDPPDDLPYWGPRVTEE